MMPLVEKIVVICIIAGAVAGLVLYILKQRKGLEGECANCSLKEKCSRVQKNGSERCSCKEKK